MGKSITDEHYIPAQYSKELLVLEKGDGVHLEDADGKRYLDLGSGIAVNAFGYGDEKLAEIVCSQMKKVVHVSNLFTTEPALELSAKLAVTGNFAAVHFGNSGSEANESALKYARLYSLKKKGEGSHKIACFTGAFHGRTLGALSCTPTEKYQKPYAPLIPGVEVFEYNNIDMLKEGLNATFAAVIIEVVQGEGGMASVTPEFTDALNTACGEHDIILIADEIQTGCGRTGEFYASSWAGLKPDIITLSKPLAGGLPLSATLIPEKINSILSVGDHGTTFGGGPVTTAVGSYVVDRIFQPGFLDSVKEKGEYLKKELETLVEKHPLATEVRGRGLMAGLVLGGKTAGTSPLDGPSAIPAVLQKAREKGVLILRSGAHVVRLVPPLVIEKSDLKAGLDILDDVLTSIESQ